MTCKHRRESSGGRNAYLHLTQFGGDDGSCDTTLVTRNRLAATVFVLAAFLCAVGCEGKKAPATGTDLGGAPAADFQLSDASGTPASLAAYRGRPVLLSFLYTSCPDVCPLIAQRTRQALDQLGANAAQVAVLFVSVDPAGDSPEGARAFMARHGLEGPDRRYLLGDEAALRPVWAAYGVASFANPAGADGGPVGHTDAVYLIDREGRKRTYLPVEAQPYEIATGLRRLLR